MSISKLTELVSKPFQDLGNAVETKRQIAAIPGEAVAIAATGPAFVAAGAAVGAFEGALRAFEPTSRSESLKVRDLIVPTSTLRGTAVAAATGALAATVFPAAAIAAQHMLGVDVGSTLLAGAAAGAGVAMGWNSFVGMIKGAFDGAAATNGVRKAFGSATQYVANGTLRFLGVAAYNGEQIAKNEWKNAKEDVRELREGVREVRSVVSHEAADAAAAIASEAKAHAEHVDAKLAEVKAPYTRTPVLSGTKSFND